MGVTPIGGREPSGWVKMAVGREETICFENETLFFVFAIVQHACNGKFEVFYQ